MLSYSTPTDGQCEVSNFRLIPVDLLFEPGIYRTSKRSGDVGAMFRIQYKSKHGCVKDYSSNLPNQFRVTQACRVKGDIWLGYWGQTMPAWSIEITKLG